MKPRATGVSLQNDLESSKKLLMKTRGAFLEENEMEITPVFTIKESRVPVEASTLLNWGFGETGVQRESFEGFEER